MLMWFSLIGLMALPIIGVTVQEIIVATQESRQAHELEMAKIEAGIVEESP